MQTTSDTQKRLALQTWQLEVVPQTTLAGRQARQRMARVRQELQTICSKKLQLAEVQRRLRAEEKGVKFYEQAQNKVND
ncbi:MAG: hypothetical protein ACK4QL_00190 [Pseudanabaenaceae cyanobacterium]